MEALKGIVLMSLFTGVCCPTSCSVKFEVRVLGGNQKMDKAREFWKFGKKIVAVGRNYR